MKTREQKQKDLENLTQRFEDASAALVIGFDKLTVPKDQELRNKLREAGAEYVVVKNTLATKAIAGKPYEAASEKLKGTSAIAFSKGDAVTLSKTLTKFVKDNNEIFKFKVGIVEGKVVDLKGVETIANLPSREELIAKVMFLMNCQAQRLVTVLSGVPRNLAIVIKQIGEQKGESQAS